MSTNWQGSERERRRQEPSLTVLEERRGKTSAPAPKSPGEAVKPQPSKPVFHQPVQDSHEPLVRGRRSAEILRKDNVDDELPATTGWQHLVQALTFGLVKPKAGKEELARRADIAKIQWIYSRPMNVIVAQPLGGVGKTTCSVGLASTFGIHATQQTLLWDDNETMGTAGIRTNSNGSTTTVWDLLANLESFERVDARKGELSYYTRHQGKNGFSVLVSDEDPDRMKQIGTQEFHRLHTLLSRFYDTLIIDTGNNTRSENWLAGLDIADQLVIPVALKRNAVVSAVRMVEQLESMSDRSGDPRYRNLVENSVVLVTDGLSASIAPRGRQELRQSLESFAHVVIDIPYDKAMDDGSIIDWQLVGDPARRAFERAGAAIADGLLTADKTTTNRK